MTDFSITNTNVRVSDVFNLIDKGSNQKSFLKNISIRNLPSVNAKTYITIEQIEGNPGLPSIFNMNEPYTEGLTTVTQYFEQFNTNIGEKIYVYRITNINLGLGSNINTIKFTDSTKNSKNVKCLMFIYNIKENGDIDTTSPIWSNNINDFITDNYYTPQETTLPQYRNIYSNVLTMTTTPKVVLDVITTSEVINIDICYTSCFGDSSYNKFTI
jgi:hypothetical protein